MKEFQAKFGSPALLAVLWYTFPPMNPQGIISKEKDDSQGQKSCRFQAQRTRERDNSFPVGSPKTIHALMEPAAVGLQVRLRRLNKTCKKHISLM